MHTLSLKNTYLTITITDILKNNISLIFVMPVYERFKTNAHMYLKKIYKMKK